MPSATEKNYSLMTSDALSAELARFRKAKEKWVLARQKEEQKLAALTGPLSEFNEILVLLNSVASVKSGNERPARHMCGKVAAIEGRYEKNYSDARGFIFCECLCQFR